MTRLWQTFRRSLPWWLLYAGIVIVADQFAHVPFDVKALLILAGVVLAVAVDRIDW